MRTSYRKLPLDGRKHFLSLSVLFGFQKSTATARIDEGDGAICWFHLIFEFVDSVCPSGPYSPVILAR
jgi:hypothetical protein